MLDSYCPFERLRDTMEVCERAIQRAQDEADALTAAGIIRAAEHWRNGKYLYLIFPQVNGQRERRYIGADPAQIEAARDSLRRAERFDLIQRVIQRQRQQLAAAKRAIEDANRALQAIQINW